MVVAHTPEDLAPRPVQGSQRLARLEFCADFAIRTGAGASRNQRSSSAMCDYSLHHVKSRPAKVGDKLRTVNFNTGTRGVASPDDRTTAVGGLSWTEPAFFQEVECAPFCLPYCTV